MGLLQKMGIKKTEFNEGFKESRQAFFLLKLAVLIDEGFSLKEALHFLLLIMPKEEYWLKEMLIRLEKGQEFYQIVAEIGFSERISSQIYLSQIHGKFSQALNNSGVYIEEKLNQRKKMKQLLQYPMFLILFMVGILVAMRLLLLPYFLQMFQNEGSSASILSQVSIGFIYYFPYLVVAVVCVFIGMKKYMNYRFKQYTAIEKINFMLKFKSSQQLIRLYYTYYFSYEWAQLFDSGNQLLRIVELMKGKETTQIMQEVAMKIEEDLKNGEKLNKIMSQFQFLTPEIGAIIFHGEQTSQLASELRLYGEACQNEFVLKIEKLMGWIQPLIFIFVAFFILCIYLALLLPMFTMMEGLS